MHAHDDRDQFAPPRPPAHLRAIVLSVLVHALLIGALTWGVHWKSSTNPPAVTAELWAAAPRQAAVEPAAPPAVPPVVPAAAPTPTARPDTAPAAQPPDTRAADIAIEREKKRQERERQEAQRRERLQKKKETEQRAKQLAEQEKQKKLAQDKLRAEQAAKSKAQAQAQEQEQEQRLARQREDNLRRLQGLAGASGGDNGTALRSAGPPGPSGSYSGKVSAKVRPNIVYPDAIAGNPRAEVEVRLSPDGTIVGKRLLQPSTSKAWDDAVLRALDKTETLPRDVDGRVPPSLVIGFRPQD